MLCLGLAYTCAEPIWMALAFQRNKHNLTCEYSRLTSDASLRRHPTYSPYSQITTAKHKDPIGRTLNLPFMCPYWGQYSCYLHVGPSESSWILVAPNFGWKQWELVDQKKCLLLHLGCVKPMAMSADKTWLSPAGTVLATHAMDFFRTSLTFTVHKSVPNHSSYMLIK